MERRRPDHARYRLVPHDPAWRRLAQAEIARLTPVFGSCLVCAHHVGSTSIPGIMAKPVLDLLAEVTDLDGLDARRSALEAIGYVWRGEHGIAGRRYIRPDDNRVHWHCYATGAAAIRDDLAFRDYLRVHPDEASRYEAAKISSMARHHAGMADYHADKSPVIAALLDRARVWQAEMAGSADNGLA